MDNEPEGTAWLESNDLPESIDFENAIECKLCSVNYNGRLVPEFMTSIVNKMMRSLTQPNIVTLWVYGSSNAVDKFKSCSVNYNGRLASKSMSSIVNKMMRALTQPNIITLGEYGSSNAMKCNVLELITRRVKRDGVFDVVVHVMANVMKTNTWYRWWSQSPDVSRIQGELGNKLGLQFHDRTTLEERARLLCQRIKMEEKILIILDDLPGGINLGEIGIPFGNDHMGCKILLVAQSQEVLSNQMNTPHIQFSVDD